MSNDDDYQPVMLSMQAHTRLMKLLPKLSAVSDHYRLKVLSDIDRVLAAEGLMWADIAAALNLPQGEDLPSAELLAIIANIEHQNTKLTTNARTFMEQMREQATEDDSVYLTFKQRAWLQALEEQGERERKRERERAELGHRQNELMAKRAEQDAKPPPDSDEDKGTLH